MICKMFMLNTNTNTIVFVTAHLTWKVDVLTWTFSRERCEPKVSITWAGIVVWHALPTTNLTTRDRIPSGVYKRISFQCIDIREQLSRNKRLDILNLALTFCAFPVNSSQTRKHRFPWNTDGSIDNWIRTTFETLFRALRERPNGSRRTQCCLPPILSPLFQWNSLSRNFYGMNI